MSMGKRFDEAVENTSFIQFLGKENVEDLKRGVKDALLNHFIEDLEKYPYYLLDVDDCESMVEDVLQELKNEIIEEYKQPLKQLLIDRLFASLDKNDLKEVLLGE